MARRFVFLQTSPQRLRLVAEDINSGSEPRLGFYFLLVSASLIASSGLVANSTAVIIGAMLVSPLMTPIFGIALGMLRSDAALLWHALTAEVMGIVLAVGFPFLFGLMPFSIEATPEMLSRTSPNLLDLLVAVFAGFAGAYALVDERLSPALPGVAIATAIVPPLANCGLCLALGEQVGAFGSFLLFGANFVTILLVGLVTFGAAGLSRDFDGTRTRGVARRLVVPVLAFVVTTVFLTQSLSKSVEERTFDLRVEEELREMFDELASTSIEDVRIARVSGSETLEVLATVRAPEVFHPAEVTRVRDRLSEQLGLKTELVVRTIVAKDVAAVGSSARASQERLDGRLFAPTTGAADSQVRIAEQVLLENLGSAPGMRLVDLNIGRTEQGVAVVATLEGFRRVLGEEIQAAQDALRKRLQLPSLELFVCVFPATLQGAEESFLVEWSDYRRLTPEDELVTKDLRRVVREETRSIGDLFCLGVHIHAGDPGEAWRVLVEVAGPRAPAPETVTALRQAVARRIPRELELSAWFRAEIVVTADGYESFRAFTRPTLERRVQNLPEIFR